MAAIEASLAEGKAPRLALGDLGAALSAGFADFRAQPLFGLFFAGVYVLVGLLLARALIDRGSVAWLLTAAAGFPLIAPFTAVGLYEVSRRREAGLPIDWKSVLGAVRGRGDDQLMLMGAFLFVAFGFWVVLARGVLAIFMSDFGLAGLATDPAVFLSSRQGILMLLVGGAIGALLAFGVFAITVVSLPMLVDREVDVITAIVTSIATVRDNPGVMLAWAALIAVALAIGMAAWFLGLLLVLPILGHATWHLYRRAVPQGA